MYYTIYQTTNLINKKIYVGLHVTDNINDSYLGSGFLLKKAFIKYGKENFKKEVLYVFDNKEDMIKKEIELVNELFINRDDTYNISKGGFGLSTLSDTMKLATIAKIKETLKNMDSTISSRKRLNTILSNDADAFKKMGIKSRITQKKNYLNGYVNPKQRFDNINIFNNNNEIIYTTMRIDLPNLCLANDLPERVLIKSLDNNGIPLYESKMPKNLKFLKYKGWYALYDTDTRINLDEYFNMLKFKRDRRSKIMSEKTILNDVKFRGRRKCGNFEIYNQNNEMIHKFNGYMRISLENLDLPVNTFIYSYRNNKKIFTGKYAGWYMLKL